MSFQGVSSGLWTILSPWEDLFNLHLNSFRCFALRSLATYGDGRLPPNHSDSMRTFLLGLLARGISNDFLPSGDDRDRQDWRARARTSSEIIHLACSTRRIRGGRPRFVYEQYIFDHVNSTIFSANVFDPLVAQGSENMPAMHVTIVLGFIALWSIVMVVVVYLYSTNMQAMERTSPTVGSPTCIVDENATDLEEIAIMTLIRDDDDSVISPTSNTMPAAHSTLSVDHSPDPEEVALWALVLDDDDTDGTRLLAVPGANVLPVVDPDFEFIDRLVQSSVRKFSEESVQERPSHQYPNDLSSNSGCTKADEEQTSQRDQSPVHAETSSDVPCSDLSTEDVFEVTSTIKESNAQTKTGDDDVALSNKHDEATLLCVRPSVDIPKIDVANISTRTFGCSTPIQWTPLQTSPRPQPSDDESASDASGDENMLESAGTTDPPSPVDYSSYVYDRRTKTLRKPRSLGCFEQIVKFGEEVVRNSDTVNPEDSFWHDEVEEAEKRNSSMDEDLEPWEQATDWRARSRSFTSTPVCDEADSLDQRSPVDGYEQLAEGGSTKKRRYSLPTIMVIPDSPSLASNRAASHARAQENDASLTAKYIPPQKRAQLKGCQSWRSTCGVPRETNASSRTFVPFNRNPSPRVATAWPPGSLYIPNPPPGEFAHIDALHEILKKLHTVTLCIEGPPSDVNELKGRRAGPETEFSAGGRTSSLNISWRDKYENNPASRLGGTLKY